MSDYDTWKLASPGDNLLDCLDCDGTGECDGEPCTNCDGEGCITREQVREEAAEIRADQQRDGRI